MKRSRRPALLRTAGGAGLGALLFLAASNFDGAYMKYIFLLLFVIGVVSVLLLFAAARMLDYLYIIATESAERNKKPPLEGSLDHK